MSFDVHVPVLFPLPFYAGAGPEEGIIFVSVSFLALMAWAAHMDWRAVAKLRSRIHGEGPDVTSVNRTPRRFSATAGPLMMDADSSVR
jgi:hypothetical protein